MNKVNFFVVKSGTVSRHIFDTCANCYPKRLGYTIEGECVRCRACDVRYSMEDLKEGIGSCYPIKLKGRVEEEFYVISGKELLKAKNIFSAIQFSMALTGV
jgi:uncharacterized membrane protein